jgi:hypothetical protein
MVRYDFEALHRIARNPLEKFGATTSGWRQDIESFGRTSARLGYELSRDQFRDVAFGEGKQIR